MSTQTIDLRGLLCPEPVLKTKKILDQPEIDSVTTLVDDEICVNNLMRLARSLKALAEVTPRQGHFQVVIRRKGDDSESTSGQPQPLPGEGKSARAGVVIFLSKDKFGDGDPQFSRTLTDLFLQTVLESGQRPQAILMANTGVRLMAPDAPTLKVLNDFRASGTEVLACGLCVEYYGLKGKINPEQITNMFAISEYLFAAEKVLTP